MTVLDQYRVSIVVNYDCGGGGISPKKRGLEGLANERHVRASGVCVITEY